jgi:hypothetical protein
MLVVPSRGENVVLRFGVREEQGEERVKVKVSTSARNGFDMIYVPFGDRYKWYHLSLLLEKSLGGIRQVVPTISDNLIYGQMKH